MRSESLSDVKNRLSEFVRLVQQGERVRILVRGEPVAELGPPTTTAESGGEEVESLVRRGLLTRGTGQLDPSIFEPKPRVAGRSLTELVIEDRER